ncbi:hypothetical protein [Falsiroseomonas sp. HW251]|uniref:hypothetical protein n=1 Tax=Falsiroseomonas sp. HW251 TaxID=3390998 RepID=UPI003D319BD9
MPDRITDFNVWQQEAGATASFPYDRITVERFRKAFPQARWRDDLRAWFVPGIRAERRVTRWMGREWSGVLAYADQRGRDAFDFDPFTSRYLEVADTFVVRTPYSRTVIAELREVPWASWDPALKACRVPFRSVEDLRKRWPAIEEAARHAEPEERRRRAENEKAPAENEKQKAEAAERRRKRYPIPDDALPPLEKVLMTHGGCLVFKDITGEAVETAIAERFYPGVTAGSGTLIWATSRRPSRDELLKAWPARTPPSPDDLARGWWQPTIEVLREERRKAASLERAQETRRSREN